MALETQPTKKKSGHFEDELYVNLIWLFLPLIVIAPVVILLPSVARTPSVFAIATIILSVCGFILFSIAKFSMFKQKRWLTFGSSHMTPRNRLFYRLGYALMICAGFIAVLLLMAANKKVIVRPNGITITTGIDN